MKLALGTAQLGLDYGVANRTGKPSFDAALSILGEAERCGISLLDTASGYGDSEFIIGQYLMQNSDGLKKPFKIATKISAGVTSSGSVSEIRELMKRQIRRSMVQLGLKKLDYCLLHDPSSMFDRHGLAVSLLQSFKEAGLTHKIGISVYTPVDVERFLMLDDLDLIQIPMNVFDYRLIGNGLLKELHSRQIEVHARSIFLQGLLLMHPSSVPAHLREAIPYLEKLHDLADDLKLSCTQLCLLYVRDMNEVSKMVVGCETVEQLQEQSYDISLPSLETGVREHISKIFNAVPENILNPSLWGKGK